MAAAAVLCGEPADAWTVEYRIVDLGIPPEWSDEEEYEPANIVIQALAINNRGEIVGHAEYGSTGYAFIWLPAENQAYGNLAPWTIHLLGRDSYSTATGHDINDNGVVAGEVGTSPRHAAVWELASSLDPAYVLGSENEIDVAMGVNQLEHYQIVGTWVKVYSAELPSGSRVHLGSPDTGTGRGNRPRTSRWLGQQHGLRHQRRSAGSRNIEVHAVQRLQPAGRCHRVGPRSPGARSAGGVRLER